jgi:hypothetical protein
LACSMIRLPWGPFVSHQLLHQYGTYGSCPPDQGSAAALRPLLYPQPQSAAEDQSWISSYSPSRTNAMHCREFCQSFSKLCFTVSNGWWCRYNNGQQKVCIESATRHKVGAMSTADGNHSVLKASCWEALLRKMEMWMWGLRRS